MNIENLNKMANYLDGGPGGEFSMRCMMNCVLGHALRVLEHREGNWNYQWALGASDRIFGISQSGRHTNDTWSFCFGAIWPDNPHLAAVRLRYVARHGEAPSKDQWERFKTEQPAIKAEEVLEEACA